MGGLTRSRNEIRASDSYFVENKTSGEDAHARRAVAPASVTYINYIGTGELLAVLLGQLLEMYQ